MEICCCRHAARLFLSLRADLACTRRCLIYDSMFMIVCRYIATAKELVIQSTLAFFEKHLFGHNASGTNAYPVTDEQRVGLLEAVVANMPRPSRYR